MSSLNAYLALLAAKEKRAIPKATKRHIHLSSSPFVIAGYHLAGDLGAPLALMWGTHSDTKPSVIVIPEPRNRQLRFDALAVFGQALVDYLSTYSETVEEKNHNGQTSEKRFDAPQIVVPNQATAEWLFGIVGRFTRSVPTEGEHAAPPVVPMAGKYLSFFHDLLPGSSLALPATQALITHWQTGQLPSEDLNLSALLGWIQPEAGIDGPTAARLGEKRPPAGPISDPNWDAHTLAELIGKWHQTENSQTQLSLQAELEAEIRDQLSHTWEDCWRALHALNQLPEADSVPHRWEKDCRRWSSHRLAMAAGTARFRNIPTPIQAARTLGMLEQATNELQAEMALDDPLVMSAYVVTGEALIAHVKSIDTNRKIAGANRPVRRPLVVLEALLSFNRPRGTKLYLASNPGVEFEVLDVQGNTVHVQVSKGAVSAATFNRLPSTGEKVVLSPFGKPEFYPSIEYGEVPWTHRLLDPTEVETNE